MNNISFGVSFKANTFIDAVNNVKNTVREKVSIVELNKNDTKDLDALFAVSDSWEKEASGNHGFNNYVNEIISKATEEDYCPDPKEEHYLALTLQKDNFEKLKAEDILAVSLFTEKDTGSELNFLQVKPNACTTLTRDDRKYRNIGTAVLDYLKYKFGHKSMYVNAAHDALGFYLKNDFEPYDIDTPMFLHYSSLDLLS